MLEYGKEEREDLCAAADVVDNCQTLRINSASPQNLRVSTCMPGIQDVMNTEVKVIEKRKRT